MARHRAWKFQPLLSVRLRTAVRAYRRPKQTPAERAAAAVTVALVAEEAADSVHRMELLLNEALAVLAEPPSEAGQQALLRIAQRMRQESGELTTLDRRRIARQHLR